MIIAAFAPNLKSDYDLVLSVGPYMNQCDLKVSPPPRKPTFKASMTGRFAHHQTILDRKKSVYGFCSQN